MSFQPLCGSGSTKDNDIVPPADISYDDVMPAAREPTYSLLVQMPNSPGRAHGDVFESDDFMVSGTSANYVSTGSMTASQSLGLGSRGINRWGGEVKKTRTHAEALGYLPHKYVPGDRMRKVLSSFNLEPANDEQGRCEYLCPIKTYSRTLPADYGEGPASTARSQESTDSIPMGSVPTLAKASLAEEVFVQVEHLKERGVSLDEITHYVYDYLSSETLPNFMRYLHLDQDGGLDRVGQLWNWQRVFWSIVLLAFVIMNIIYLLVSNWAIFEGVMTHIVSDSYKTVNSFDNLSEKVDEFTEDAVAETNEMDIYFQIQDKTRRSQILHLAGVVGTCEVTWVLFMIARAIWQCKVFICDPVEYRSYERGTRFFQDSLPVLSTFSLLKFVSFVHPSLIATSWLEVQQQRHLHGVLGPVSAQVATGVFFIVSRLLLGFLAVVSFSTKLLAVCLKLIDPNCSFWYLLIETALLMNQCIGCVLFERVLQDRVFLFIFGGSDTEFREDELALKGVYRCRVAKQIWEEFWVKAPRCQGWKAIALLATLDHFDLQMLLQDDHGHEQHVAVDTDGCIIKDVPNFSSQDLAKMHSGHINRMSSDEYV